MKARLIKEYNIDNIDYIDNSESFTYVIFGISMESLR